MFLIMLVAVVAIILLLRFLYYDCRTTDAEEQEAGRHTGPAAAAAGEQRRRRRLGRQGTGIDGSGLGRGDGAACADGRRATSVVHVPEGGRMVLPVWHDDQEKIGQRVTVTIHVPVLFAGERMRAHATTLLGVGCTALRRPGEQAPKAYNNLGLEHSKRSTLLRLHVLC
jgi:hypothetical protein